ncbi:MAG: oligosaccharide flippase family protein [Candidatus Dormibacteraeota bacterium]|uniref:Oligosaccharide flippase family protein n=1 Tax=Candidatus Amunia macphersoniae TaxID=3127014 RepID=A0A934KHU7_9BACT|nr:oligosaccharide flippase family protein [Candidatus Dormibacteraeota bacterium]
MNTDLARRATRGTAWVAIATWLNRLFVLLVVLVLARNLDARQFGVLAVAALAANVALQLNDGGMADALVWWPGHVREAAETTLLSCLTVGAIGGGVLALGAPAIAGVFGAPDATPLLRVYAVAILFDATAGAYLGMLTRELAFRKRFFPEVVPSVCASIVTVGLALGGAGIWSLVVGDVLRSALQLAIGFAVAGRGMLPRWHGAVARRLWRYGRAALAGSFLEFALQNVDYALVALLLGPVALGLYTIAFRLAILPFLIVTYVIGGVAFPLYARLVGDPAAVQRLLQLSMRACCSLVFLMGAGLATLAPSVEVLGERWAPAVPVARLLGIYICLRSAAFMISMLLRVVSPVANALLRGAWVLLLIALITTLGRTSITTVGAIQMVVAAALLAAYLVVTRRLARVAITPIIADISRCGVAALIAAAATLAVRQGVGALSDPSSRGALLLLGITFFASYVLALAVVLPGVAGDLRRVRALALRPAPGVVAAATTATVP